jgi:hypothetical protein
MNKNWKTEYWPEIIRLNIEVNKNGKNNIQQPQMYDYHGLISETIGMPSSGVYFTLNTVEKTEALVKNWDLLLAPTKRNIRRIMKYYEDKHLIKAVYIKRKGEFDALVAEINT